MDVLEAIRKRHSVRTYKSKPIPKKTMKKLLEAARIAPSASNIQPWHFIIVTDREKRIRLTRGGRYAKPVAKAPTVIVGCGDKEASPKWYKVDVTIALEHIALAATNEGLGTCWIGSFTETQVREMLKIPDNFAVVALLTVGYPREKPDIETRVLRAKRERKSLNEIVSYEEF